MQNGICLTCAKGDQLFDMDMHVVSVVHVVSVPLHHDKGSEMSQFLGSFLGGPKPS